METGYRSSNLARALEGKNAMNALSNASVLLAIAMESRGSSWPIIAGFLFLRQIVALWQSLFTLFQMENFVNRRYFSLGVNLLQIVVIPIAAIREGIVFHAPYLALAVSIYVIQCALPLRAWILK